MKLGRVVAIVLLSLAVSCSTSDPVAVESGVRGTITSGPQCPVEQEGQSCPDQPVAEAVVTLVTVGGESILARRTSDADGKFEVAIRPGRYVIAVASGTLTCLPETVTVAEKSFTTLDISCDTGIR
jgi:hypothetical protein